MAHSPEAADKINGFYQSLFGADASPTDLANCQAALAAGQSLAEQSHEDVPGGATGGDDGVVIGEHTVGKLVLAEVLRHVLPRVQLGRYGGRRSGLTLPGTRSRPPVWC